MSPTRYLPVISGSMWSLPVTRARRSAISCTLTLSPLPMFTALPSAASLGSILEHERRPAVEQAAGEDRQDTGVRVRQRLVASVDVEEAQRDGRDAVGRAEQQAHPLLVVLPERVDR